MVDLLRFRVWIKEEKCFADYIETIRYYAKEVDLCWGEICESDCFDFEDVIFTQSTGLCDKKGKEIFEGDILKVVDKYEYTGGSIETVSYSKAQASFVTTDVERNIYKLCNTLMFDVEVIGNIYQNKDLLKEN